MFGGVGSGNPLADTWTLAPQDSSPATPSNVAASMNGDETATVSFSAPQADGGAITTYTVTADDETSSGGGTPVVTGSSSPITVSGLTTGNVYVFAVTATNAFGTSGAASSSPVVVPDVATTSVTPAASA
jgi:hypothetical protein